MFSTNQTSLSRVLVLSGSNCLPLLLPSHKATATLHDSSLSPRPRPRPERLSPAAAAEMAMRHLITGQGNCAPDGASSSNPFGNLANAIFGQSSKAQVKLSPSPSHLLSTTTGLLLAVRRLGCGWLMVGDGSIPAPFRSLPFPLLRDVIVWWKRRNFV